MKLSEVSISLRTEIVVLVLESKGPRIQGSLIATKYSGNKTDKRAMYNAQIKIISL